MSELIGYLVKLAIWVGIPVATLAYLGSLAIDAAWLSVGRGF